MQREKIIVHDNEYKDLTNVSKKHLLSVSFALFVFISMFGAVYNVAFTHNRAAIVWFLILLLATGAIWVYYLLTQKTEVTATLITLLAVLGYLTYLHIGKYTIFVLYFFPPVAIISFYLMGRLKGILFSFFALLGSILSVILTQNQWQNSLFSFGSLFNFALGAAASISLIALYEMSLYKTQLEIKKVNDNLKFLSTTDTLTGLHNRQWLDTELRCRIHNAQKGKGFSVFIIDIDDFKKINDCYGHIVGDEVLRSFSHLIAATMENKCPLGRWGGEEFLAICDAPTHQEAVEHAEIIRQAVEKSDLHAKNKITASIGVAIYKKEDSVISIVHRADQRLYKAKAEGKNRVCATNIDDKQTNGVYVY